MTLDTSFPTAPLELRALFNHIILRRHPNVSNNYSAKLTL
jgi:hypothetical protein